MDGIILAARSLQVSLWRRLERSHIVMRNRFAIAHDDDPL